MPTAPDPTPITLSTGRPPQAAGAPRRERRAGLLAGAAVLLACAACCLPLLTAGAAAISAGALVTVTGGIALGVLTATLVAAGTFWVRRRRTAERSAVQSCGCGGGCAC